MNRFTEFETALFNKYPGFFRQAWLTEIETCMCWGLECPDNWDPYIKTMIERIAEVVNDGDIEFVQIKEKFFMLRVYYDIVGNVTKEQEKQIDNIIQDTENQIAELEAEWRKNLKRV